MRIILRGAGVKEKIHSLAFIAIYAWLRSCIAMFVDLNGLLLLKDELPSLRL